MHKCTHLAQATSQEQLKCSIKVHTTERSDRRRQLHNRLAMSYNDMKLTTLRVVLPNKLNKYSFILRHMYVGFYGKKQFISEFL